MIILALAVASWTNAGWADNPKPTVVKASWASDPFARQVLPVVLRDDKSPAPKPSEPTPKVPKSPAAPQKMWYLVDRSGQRWHHQDLRWLQTWIDQRNAALAPKYTAPVLQYGSPCANGACQR